MARKVIIDCDPGIDDAVALCMALFDPSLEVLAITAVEGCVPAEQTNRNLLGLLEWLDPPLLPRIGEASPADDAPAVDTRTLHGDDGLGNINFDVSSLHHSHPSEKIIQDVLRTYPGDVSIIALGPLTNIARAFRRDPPLATMIDQLIVMGGSLDGIGNITPSAEFNIYYDPDSAREIMRARLTKTLVPLDVTRQVSFSLDLIDQMPDASSRIGRFLRHVLPFSFRAYHQRLGLESININDAVGLMAAIRPELFRVEEMAGDVEISGELTRGVTVFDRRVHREWRPNMSVAVEVDAAACCQAVIECLRHAGSRTG